jgi:hypothetical protein
MCSEWGVKALGNDGKPFYFNGLTERGKLLKQFLAAPSLATTRLKPGVNEMRFPVIRIFILLLWMQRMSGVLT